jgi:signal transduction histidine kinase
VLRHGGPGATARVRVEVDAGALRLEVTDTGRGVAPAPSAGGQGIDGMRARAAALGGSLEAGPRPEGGFAVRARLPVPDRVAAPGERP